MFESSSSILDVCLWRFLFQDIPPLFDCSCEMLL